MLFTVILEFDGVTSVSQFDKTNPATVFREWLHELSRPEKFGLTLRQANALAAAFEIHQNEKPTALRDTRNVWCTSAFVGRKIALLNIVATVSEHIK